MPGLALRENEAPQHADLLKDIAKYKIFGKSLREEVVLQPLIDVISTILDLPDDLSEMDRPAIDEVRKRVGECKRVLDDFGYSYVESMISPAEQSTVFEIVNQSDLFAKALKKSVGKKVTLEDGNEVVMTAALCDALTRFRFSIGTPPITPKGIKAIEQMIFGGSLQDIYQFRELLGGGPTVKYLFDAFIRNVDNLVGQSTHYTTAAEKKQFEKKAVDFNNFEGLRGLKKSVVSGTAKTAIRLIKEKLFRKHDRDSRTVEVLEEADCLDDALIAKMRANKETFFVVRVTKVPHNLLAHKKLDEKWHGILGRLILVQDSPNSRRSSTTVVYSLFPEITKALDVFHVKDSGTPANTQLNLRSIIENFSPEALTVLEDKVKAKITEHQARGADRHPAEEVRKQEWKLTAQKDYLNLKKFLQFIEFIKRIQSADDTELQALQAELMAKNEKFATDYFFKGLKGKGYQIVSVPQGGGRKEIGHVGQFFRAKFDHRLANFDQEGCSRRLAELKAARGIAHSDDESTMLHVTEIQSNTPAAALRSDKRTPSRATSLLAEKLRVLSRRGIEGADSLLARLDALVEQETASNVSGKMRAKVAQALRRVDLGAAAKMMERPPFTSVGQVLRDGLGLVKKHLGGGIEDLEQAVNDLEAQTDSPDLSLASQLLEDIKKGALRPNLALCEVGWSFNDVMEEDDFPAGNHLRIPLNDNGELDAKSLEKQLENVRRNLRDFPELFDLFCASTILIINDPHNPTSHVMRNETKLELLGIAAKYGLTILADDAYHKQIGKEMKDLQTDITLAEFYEKNKGRFSRPVTMYSSLPTTKWAMGAGERVGVVATNDKDVVNGQDYRAFVRANTDSVNSMSLYLDNEKYNIGLKTKAVCKRLEPLTLVPRTAGLGIVSAERTIDEILTDSFSNFEEEGFSGPIRSALIEARNDLDRLRIRAATDLEVCQYVSDLISKLKDFRLDKQTQKDSSERSKVVAMAIKRVAEQHPFLATVSINPEGPFYVCVKLDEKPEDKALKPFLTAIARARNIAVVPTKKGYVRFSFGSALDGTPEDYQTLGLAIETDLRILIDYWGKFTQERDTLRTAGDPDANAHALGKLFPGGEIEIARTLNEKKPLIERLSTRKGPNRKQLVFDRPANIAEGITSIEPDSAASIVTLTEIKCSNLGEFVNSRQFRDVFNYYLLKVKSRVPALQHLEDTDVTANFGARKFAEKVKTSMFKDDEREIFEQIAIEIAKIWFSDNTIKILASQEEDSSAKALDGAEKALGKHLRAFLDTFVTPDGQRGLLQSLRQVDPKVAEYLSVETKYPATFQAGYRAVNGVHPNNGLPAWSRKMISKGEFVANSTDTDPSPVLSTAGTARVPGVDRAILRRDGDGKNAPEKQFFRERLEKFAEVMDQKDYVMKMVQVGGTKVLLVMNRSYSHYMVEELRLFPQTDLTPEDLENCKPDAVSFMGLPSKVMGEDYRIGFFLDEDDRGDTIPVSWVDAEGITDYMGYLKKPVLTVANEKVREKGMMPVHGSAFSIIFKNGLRKTIVMGGDSGTGKSETIIAMTEQIITNQGLAAQVEGIEFLSGDMLSLFKGNDGQMYMLGTEQGDFMRMTDIPGDWKERFRNRINGGSKTNLSDPTNPRITIGNLCNPMEFQKPTRVNCFFNINNFASPAGASVRQVESARNLVLGEYVRGRRGEKGTSGDQPNIYASVEETNLPDAGAITSEFGRELDVLLGWDILTGPSGKEANAYLKFNDIHGGVFKAKSIVDKLVLGKKVKGGEIVATRYDCRQNRYFVTLQDEKGERKEVPFDRNGIFNKIYTPIASTYAGNPFVSPGKMGPTLERFADVMQSAGVITGTLYTQLKVAGMEFSGPAKASQDLLQFLTQDEGVNKRFQTHMRRVEGELSSKYGVRVFNSSTIPDGLMAHNLFLLERHESDNVYPVDADGNRIPLETPPHYKYDPDRDKNPFNPGLITPEISAAISDICENDENNKLNLRSFEFSSTEYASIHAWDNKEELIYQILIINGLAELNCDEVSIASIPVSEVKKAEKIAHAIMKQRQSGHNDVTARVA